MPALPTAPQIPVPAPSRAPRLRARGSPTQRVGLVFVELTEQQWQRLKGAVEEVGSHGPFDANAALRRFLEIEWEAGNTPRGVPIINAAAIRIVLQDMVDLGYLRTLGGDPPRWELAR